MGDIERRHTLELASAAADHARANQTVLAVTTTWTPSSPQCAPNAASSLETSDPA